MEWFILTQHPSSILNKKWRIIYVSSDTQTTRKVTMNQKEKVSCVWMYLGVQCISEVCSVDGTSFVPGILEGDDCQLNYQTTLMKLYQEKADQHGWTLWKRMLIMLIPTSSTKTNKLQQKLGKWINTHSKCGKWLLYQDQNRNFYAKEIHEDIE